MRRSLRFPRALVVLVVLTAMVVPLGGVAQANHPGGSCLDLSPEGETNSLGTVHVVTATLRTPSGGTCGAGQTAVDPTNGSVTIHFEITGVNDPDAGNSLTSPDRSCTIQPNQTSCTTSYTGNNAGTDTIRGWVDEVDGSGDADEQEGVAEGTTPGRVAEADATDVISKTWANQSTAFNLDCSPETATNPAGTSHTIGCTARDASGNLLANVRVDVEATGANDPDNANSLTSPDFTCTTATSGTCQFTHGTGTGGAGTTTYRAWVDADNNNNSVEADQSEGQDSGAQAGSVPENDNTDVVTKTWNAAAPTVLDCDDQTGPDTERESNPGTGSGDPTSAETYTCRVTDTAGNPSGTFTVLAEVETAVNDPDSPDSNSYGSPDYQCTTTNGTCTITVRQVENELGTTTICFWVGDGATLCGAEVTGENQAAGGSDAGNDFADKLEKTWVSNTTASRLDCTPETASNPLNTTHTITCTARDANNAVINGAQIDAELTGANDPDTANSPTSPDLTCTTAGSGTCNLVDSTGNTTAGLTTYRIWIDRDASNATVEADTTEARDEVATPGAKAETDDTDVVTKNWMGPPSRLTISPTSDSASVGTCNEFTITITDAGNQGVGNLVVDVEQVHQLAADGTANNEPTVSFCTPTAGPNPTSVNTAAGDRVESPDNVGTAGGEATARTDASGRVTIGVAVASSNGAPGTGNVTVTAFYETSDDDDPNGSDLQATATKTWVVPQSRTIDCLPKSGTSATGQNYNVTCTVRDRFGQPLSGQSVVFTTAGPGVLSSATTVVTNQFGQATVTATSLDPGVQTITGTLQDDLVGAEPGELDECDRSANDPSGAPAGVCSSAVTHTWTQAAVASITLTPDETVTRVGGQSTFQFRAFDANGQPVAGVPVTWNLSGQGKFVSRDAETNATGVATAVLTTNNPGNSRLTASTPGCSGTCSDTSVQHWGPAACDVFGTDRSDVLRGTSRGDTICGFGGSDRLVGRGGDDILLAGRGDDTLRGGSGSDSLKGGPGDDTISGGDGSDLLYGGPGNDVMNGNGGVDGCRPGPGRDEERNCEGSIVSRRRPS